MRGVGLVVSVMLLTGVAGPLSAETIRVSQTGPIRTISAAQQAVRDLKANKHEGLIAVELADGVYRLSETLVFTPEDSGTKNAPILWRAAANATPVISSGRPITGWKQIKDTLWSCNLPDVKAGNWTFRQLFVNGKRMRRVARSQLGAGQQ